MVRGSAALQNASVTAESSVGRRGVRGWGGLFDIPSGMLTADWRPAERLVGPGVGGGGVCQRRVLPAAGSLFPSLPAPPECHPLSE